MRRRPVLPAVVSAALAVTWALGPGGVAHGAPRAGEEVPPSGVPLGRIADPLRPSGADGGDGTAAKVARPLLHADGQVTAFVRLDAPSGLDTAEAGGDRADVAAAAVEVEQLADQVLPEPGASVAPDEVPEAVTVTTNVVAGVVVSGDAARIRALAAQDAVVSVHLMVPKRPLNKGTDALTRAVQAWQATDQTGEGVRIGVIDTGIDYTHAMFGGPGTRKAYDDAYGTAGRGKEPAHLFDGAKYLGGFDFAGPRYDANPGSGDPERSTTPRPDENPIDAYYTGPTSGHGTHVAGTAAGYGVTADGTTFRGDYSTLDGLDGWRIGPGSAPRAGLYALKVFGDRGGSTNLTMQALERAADPNKDLDYNDHLDIVNLSLGADTAPADDPDNLFIDRLARIGMLAVVAAGNAGDVTDVGGSPGNAGSALAVASSVGLTQTFDAVRVVGADDPALLGTHPAQNSVDYTGGVDVTAPVTDLGADVSGCDALTTEQAEDAKGRIVWLWWDDDDATRGCGSRARWDNAKAAGAAGVLIGTELPVFPAGIAGNAMIPGAQLTAASTDRLREAVRAGTLVVQLGPSLRGAGLATDPALADLLNPGSSRGVHGSLGIGKPDVAAPGTRISSAASGTGDQASTLSGTSMAAPHVAGIAALVAGARPGWTAHAIKAAVMNTATHDVFRDPGQTGPVHGPQRVGAGRVDALDATRTEVIAFATDQPGGVSVEFGVVGVGAETLVEHRTVTVQNTGAEAASFTTSFVAATTAGGATITARPARVTVPPGGSALVTVTLTADPTTLRRDPDPTSEPAYDLGRAMPVPREYVASVSGRLVLTPRSGSPLRVPVHAAPRPVSDLGAAPVVFAGPGATTAPLVLTGRGVGSGGWTSLLLPFHLVAEDPRQEDLPAGPDGPGVSASSLAAADLRYVGFASTAPQLAARGGRRGQGSIGIGIVTQGEWATLGTNVVPVIQTDIDGNGRWDLRTYVGKFARGLDYTSVETYRLEHSAETGYTLGQLLDQSEVNDLEPGTDSTVFDNNVVVAPIDLAAVGIKEGHTPTFVVATLSPYAPGPGDVVDESEPFTADPFRPALWFDAGRGSEASLWFRGAPGTPFTVHRSSAATDARLLLLHSHNPAGRRAEVVELRDAVVTPTATTLTVEGPLTAGAEQLLTAVVAPAAATGTVRFLDGAGELGRSRVTSGSASMPVSLTPGTHALQAVFVPDGPEWSASSSDVVTVEVGREVPVLTAVAGSVRHGSPALVTALVRTQGPTATGTVQVHEGERLLGSARVFAGWSGAAALVRLPRDLAVGEHRLTVTYLGDVHVAPVSVERVLTVLPPRGG